MITSALYVLLVMQASESFPVPRTATEHGWNFKAPLPADALAPAATDRDGATRDGATEALQKLRFVTSFNQLVVSLKSFAESYNAGQLDVRKVKAVKKAWRELESSEAWFKPDKKK
jgi:hypothetical protein